MTIPHNAIYGSPRWRNLTGSPMSWTGTHAQFR